MKKTRKIGALVLIVMLVLVMIVQAVPAPPPGQGGTPPGQGGSPPGLSGNTGWTVNGTTVYKTDLEGNVGIGMIDPQYKLDVDGDVHVTGHYIAGSTTTYGDGSIDLSSGTDLDIDSGTLFVKNANNRVGIGTQNPQYPLDVDGSIRIANPSAFFVFDDGFLNRVALNTLSTSSTNSILEVGGGFHIVHIDPYTKVGIGTLAPQEKLDVVGNIHASGNFKAGSSTTYGDGSIDLSSGTDLNIDSGTLFINNANNRVGIGTLNPQYPLDVDGSIRIANPSAFFIFDDGFLNRVALNTLSTSSTNSILEVGGGFHTVHTDPYTNVGIGTTSPDYKLTIGDGTTERIHFSGSTSPSNPPFGSVVIYFDGTDLIAKNSSGTTKTIADF